MKEAWAARGWEGTAWVVVVVVVVAVSAAMSWRWVVRFLFGFI